MHPVRLMRPKPAQLSPVARLGRDLFFDRTLSSSGRMSCGTCHVPANAYASRNVAAAIAGVRAMPSLRYLDRAPAFHLGADAGESDESPTAAMSPRGSAGRATPRGGLFWDGRAATLQDQAVFPLL